MGPHTMRAHDARAAHMVSSERLRQVHDLWDELADFGAHEIDAAPMHALRATSGLIDAQQAFWIGTVRMVPSQTDVLAGWRLRALRRLHSAEADRTTLKRAQQFH